MVGVYVLLRYLYKYMPIANHTDPSFFIISRLLPPSSNALVIPGLVNIDMHQQYNLLYTIQYNLRYTTD